MSWKRIERREFSHKNSLCKERRGCCWGCRLFRPLVFEKSIHYSVKASWWRKRAPPKTRTLNEKERMKKEDTKKHGQKASFFQANRKREKQRVYSYKREYTTTCALSNALFRRRRERSERGFFILVKRNKEVLLAYARLGVLCSRERAVSYTHLTLPTIYSV